MRWKFWQSDNQDNATEEQQKPEPSQDNKPEQTGNEGATSHKVLNTQIDALIADTLAYIKPITDEIQINRGNSRHIQSWIANPDNLVKTVLSYAERGEYPSQKDLMYSDIYGSTVQIDSREAAEYKERLEKFVQENRPEDGMIKNITWFKGEKSEAIVEKKDFLEKFRLFAQALRADVETEKQQSEKDVTKAKAAATETLSRLFKFYERLEEAIQERDLDAMLDVSNNRVDNIVHKILDIDWSEMAEGHEGIAISALVKAMNVYDELIDLAASVKSEEEAHSVLQKILSDVTAPEKIISFTENVLQKIDENENPLAHNAYFDFLQSYIGDTIPTSTNAYLLHNKIISATFKDGFSQLRLLTKGGETPAEATTVMFDDAFVGAAYYSNFI